jgi:outer membrane biosynthesis protein TonB
MPRLFGPRTAVEAAFIVAVPISVGFGFGASRWTIVAAAGVAYLLIVLVEAFIWYEGKRAPASARRLRSLFGRRPKREEAPVTAEPAEESVVVRPRTEPEADAVPAPAEPVSEPAPRAPGEHVRVLRREPEPAPEPEPEPVIAAVPEPERAPLVAVPAPEPEPVSVAAPAQPAAASTVVPIGVGSAPRQWNLWDLERLTRENAGGDSARNEERTFLLMYLREFADADGMLPVDFDGLVRDSFGDLVGSR